MHYYSHNIPDYRKDTTHLTMTEHGAYRQMLDWYYLDEMPLPADLKKIMRRVSARTEDERDAVQNVLDDFFTLSGGGYIHHRCDEELGKIYEKSDKARSSAEKRWNKNASESDTQKMRTQCERIPNAKKDSANAEETHGDSMLPINLINTNNTITKEITVEFFENDLWPLWGKGARKSDARKWLEGKGRRKGKDFVLSLRDKISDYNQWRESAAIAGDFVPQRPALVVWLNGERWEDELGAPSGGEPIDYLAGVLNA